jgi:hypothetical protein
VSAPTGRVLALADPRAPFADFPVRRSGRRPSLALDARESGPEAAMNGTSKTQRSGNYWLVEAIWMAAVGLFIAELIAGSDYVQASLGRCLNGLFGWLPTLALMTIHATGQAIWNLERVEFAFRWLALVAIPFVLMGIGLVLKRRATW